MKKPTRKEIAHLLEAIKKSFTETLGINTDFNCTQWAFYQPNEEFLPEKFEIVYHQNEIKLADGDNDAGLFKLGKIAANFISEEMLCSITTEPFIIVRKRLNEGL